MTFLATALHLGNKPSGVVLLILIVAFLCFFAGAVAAYIMKAFWAIAIAVGLALFVLAFVVT